ncbi:MAG TPA: hypothetical protein PLA71_06665 [Saccharofermentans sp.]|nr:hypothetical protein [Saccharofermentans sp.]
MAKRLTKPTAPKGKRFVQLVISNETLAKAMKIVTIEEIPEHDSTAVVTAVKRLMDEYGLSIKQVAHRLRIGKTTNQKESNAMRSKLIEQVIEAVIGEGEMTEQAAELLKNTLSRTQASTSDF